MNTEDKIAEQAAEIANLNLVLAERQAKIGQLMGEAARAGIVGATVASVAQDRNYENLPRYIIGHLGKVERDDTYGPWMKGLDVMGASTSHPDDLAVQRFADAMKAKMAAQRAKGYGGWDNHAQCTDESLADRLMRHAQKGDPVDVANFAMMLHQRHGGDTFIVADVLRIAALDYAKRVASMWIPEAPATPAAPLPEQTGPSAEDDPEFDDLIGKLAKANASSEWDEGKACREWRDELVAYIDSRSAASPSPAPAQQQEPTDSTTLDCPDCGGSGEAFGSFACEECHGQGKIIVSAAEVGGIASKESADCVAVPVKALSLAVITLAHASSGNPLYDEAYNELGRIIKAHRMSKESVEPAAPGASTEDTQ